MFLSNNAMISLDRCPNLTGEQSSGQRDKPVHALPVEVSSLCFAPVEERLDMGALIATPVGVGVWPGSFPATMNMQGNQSLRRQVFEATDDGVNSHIFQLL
jgi:hypothetical protein